MFGPNTGHGAIINVRGSVAGTAITLNTEDIVAPNRIFIASLYLYTEGAGPGSSTYFDIQKKSDSTILQRIIRFKPVAANPFSIEIPVMRFLSVPGEALKVVFNAADGTLILANLNYLVI